jgi:hypothetical protein
MTETAETLETPQFPDIPRTPDGRFAPGAPGRPVGAYGRASRRAALALLADFEANQAELIAELKARPAQYWRVMSLVLPKRADSGLPDPTYWTESEAYRVVQEAWTVLSQNNGFNCDAVAALDAVLERRDLRPA